MARVKFLQESAVYQALAAEIKAECLAAVSAGQNVESAVNNRVAAIFAGLPNEANGDAVPANGLYRSGGVVKVAP